MSLILGGLSFWQWGNLVSNFSLATCENLQHRKRKSGFLLARNWLLTLEKQKDDLGLRLIPFFWVWPTFRDAWIQNIKTFWLEIQKTVWQHFGLKPGWSCRILNSKYLRNYKLNSTSHVCVCDQSGCAWTKLGWNCRFLRITQNWIGMAYFCVWSALGFVWVRFHVTSVHHHFRWGAHHLLVLLLLLLLLLLLKLRIPLVYQVLYLRVQQVCF